MSKHVTIVFDFDIKQFEGNPFKAETPFGQPVGITNGDLQESAAVTEELATALREVLRLIYAEGLANLTKQAWDALGRAEEALANYAGAE